MPLFGSLLVEGFCVIAWTWFHDHDNAVANWTSMYNDQLKYLSSSSLIYVYSSKLLQNMF